MKKRNNQDKLYNIPRNIEAIMKYKGIKKQKDFAKLIGVSNQAVNSWILGEKPPENENIKKISKVSGFPVNTIINTDLTKYIEDILSLEMSRKEIIQLDYLTAPFVPLPKIKENKLFQQAYEIQKEIYFSQAKPENFQLTNQKIEESIEIYKKLIKEKNSESCINLISWYCRIASYLQADPIIQKNILDYDYGNFSFKEINKYQKNNQLTDNEKKELSNLKKALMPEMRKIVKECIKILKEAKKYNELLEYLISRCYTLLLIDNDLTEEINELIGEELFRMLTENNNKYALKFLLQYEKIHH